ncbi:MAG: 4-hydroxyphenylpyruvate dioxygenase family protein [Phyllobacterium sp.]
MRAVAATGYEGYLSLEIFNDQFRGGSTRSIAIDGHRSLIYLGDQVARAEPDNAINAPKMPDRIEVKSVEFIEFASSSEQVGNLTRLIETLGFHKAGRHRSRSIERYRQGDINLVVNLEREGFAHRSFLTHGTSPYAVGLKVHNAEAALLRAKTLGAKVLVRDLGAGKIVLPAIEGVGGSIIYFIDEQSDLRNIWDIDFEVVTPENAPTDSGLTHIDHLAETMNFDEMLTWLLFYTAIFRAGKTPMVDIVDPSGIVRSQVVENDTGSLRITMNGAENRNTVAGTFLANNSGPSIQHLAFGTSDIFATAEALKANGFVPLKITPNYYADIEARFGLNPALTDRLKAGNILYDQDEGGEYFQLYSPNFGDGLFFEIVERRGYKGYGAPNSIFRIAAQKRHTVL